MNTTARVLVAKPVIGTPQYVTQIQDAERTRMLKDYLIKDLGFTLKLY